MHIVAAASSASRAGPQAHQAAAQAAARRAPYARTRASRQARPESPPAPTRTPRRRCRCRRTRAHLAPARSQESPLQPRCCPAPAQPLRQPPALRARADRAQRRSTSPARVPARVPYMPGLAPAGAAPRGPCMSHSPPAPAATRQRKRPRPPLQRLLGTAPRPQPLRTALLPARPRASQAQRPPPPAPPRRRRAPPRRSGRRPAPAGASTRAPPARRGRTRARPAAGSRPGGAPRGATTRTGTPRGCTARARPSTPPRRQHPGRPRAADEQQKVPSQASTHADRPRRRCLVAESCTEMLQERKAGPPAPRTTTTGPPHTDTPSRRMPCAHITPSAGYKSLRAMRPQRRRMLHAADGEAHDRKRGALRGSGRSLRSGRVALLRGLLARAPARRTGRASAGGWGTAPAGARRPGRSCAAAAHAAAPARPPRPSPLSPGPGAPAHVQPPRSVRSDKQGLPPQTAQRLQDQEAPALRRARGMARLQRTKRAASACQGRRVLSSLAPSGGQALPLALTYPRPCARRACRTLFMKQVLPRLASPRSPGGWPSAAATADAPDASAARSLPPGSHAAPARRGAAGLRGGHGFEAHHAA